MPISESLARKIPHRFKPPLRKLFRYLRLEKSKPVKILRTKRRIKRSQDKLLRENYSANTEKLIVFLTPGSYDHVDGGILSVSSIYEETIKLHHIHGAEVIMCNTPGFPNLLKFTKFENQNYLYRFSQILPYFHNLQNLMIHVPGGLVALFLKNISNEDRFKLTAVNDVHINIMIQHILLLESLGPMDYIEELKQLGKVTCTTAHEQYTTLALRERLGIPLHKLSTFASPEQYSKKTYVEKENMMIVSHDRHPKKSEVLNLLAGEFPQLRIQIIKNLTYEEYKEVISRAKWALTFGEGLDFYFIETIFSGGVSLSVYNSSFFSKDFKSLRTVYDSYDIMIEKLCSDIRDLDDETNYTVYQSKQFDLCCKYYDYKQYVNNLELFYKGQYTYG